MSLYNVNVLTGSKSESRRRYDVGNSSIGGNKRNGGSQSDFGPIEGYISETVQDRR